MTMMRIYSNPNELYHHGILGQRWGHRNGPPYPLDPNRHSASERKAGWKKSLDASDDDEESKLKKFVNSKGFKVALGVTVAAAVTYGAYRVGKSHLIGGKKFDKLLAKSLKEIEKSVNIKELKEFGMSDKDIAEAIKKAKDTTIKAFEDTRKNYKGLKPNFDSLDDVPKATRDFYSEFFNSSSDDAFKILTDGVNHGINESSLVDDFVSGGGRHMNCTMCSASIAMKLKGFDVSASTSKLGIFAHKVEKWFDGGKFIKPKLDDGKELYEYLLKQGDGHYGFMTVSIKTAGQHSIFYTVKNGAVEIMDGQMNKSYGKTVSSLTENLFNSIDLRKTEIMDVTNLKPTKEVLKAITPAYDAVKNPRVDLRAIKAAAKAKRSAFDSFIKQEMLPVPKNMDPLEMTADQINTWKNNLVRAKWADADELDSIFRKLEEILK